MWVWICRFSSNIKSLTEGNNNKDLKKLWELGKTFSILITNIIRTKRKLLWKFYQKVNFVIQWQHGRGIRFMCVIEDILFCRQNHWCAVLESFFFFWYIHVTCIKGEVLNNLFYSSLKTMNGENKVTLRSKFWWGLERMCHDL